jgi:hypothetical protein
MAFDQRFAMVLVGSSGKGGATPLRATTAALEPTGGEYYWMAGNFMKYAHRGYFWQQDARIPVDSNELIAFCAAPPFISWNSEKKATLTGSIMKAA